MLFAAVSDVVWQAIIAGIVTVVLAYMQQRTQAAVKKVSDEAASAAVVAAEKTDEVKLALQESTGTTEAMLDGLVKVADATHTLVNSQHGIALSTVYEQALKIAALTGDPADRKKAEVARQKLDDHEAKQSRVDEGKKAK